MLLPFPSSHAFTSIAVPPHRYVVASTIHATSRRKRRLRKDDEDEPPSTGDEPGELPDFDLNDDDDTGGNRVARPVSASQTKPSSTYKDPLGDISANMMGSTDRPGAKSVKELLNDRSLEKRFEFSQDSADDDASLPDLLAPLKGNSRPVATDGQSKRERQAVRRLEAQAAAQKEEEKQSLLSKLPLIRNDQGEISPLKILENATWVCIWSLVAWEVYLNSPFFDRAAPMAPIVYDLFM